MSTKSLRLISSAALALLLAVACSLSRAAPDPLPANSNAYGQGYAKLTASWLEWVTAIPSASNPLFDNTGANAAVGQSGKVWFLAGTTSVGSTTRIVTVPTGTALFFPIVNIFWVNTPETGDPPWSPAHEAYVRSFLAANIDTADGLVLEIDGRTVADLSTLRVSGAVGQCTLPEDNIFGGGAAPGPHECVADGYWALLPPLSAGSHTIRFAGAINSVGFSLQITYYITVSAR